MKLLRNYSLLALLFSLVFVSCSKDDDKPGPSKTSHKVVFKAIASEGSNITVAVYGYDSEITTATSLNGSTWTSPEVTVPAGTIVANASVGADGKDANSSLKVQVYVDGELKKEGTSTGEFLNASASYSF